MPRMKLPEKVALQVWLTTGGRCACPGCSKPLWKQTITLHQMNVAYPAHIVADSAEGPRGEQVLRPRFKVDPSNIMPSCSRTTRSLMRSPDRSPCYASTRGSTCARWLYG